MKKSERKAVKKMTKLIEQLSADVEQTENAISELEKHVEFKQDMIMRYQSKIHYLEMGDEFLF
jgi:peptidoglycan hydrolase CwlO-like protein